MQLRKNLNAVTPCLSPQMRNLNFVTYAEEFLVQTFYLFFGSQGSYIKALKFKYALSALDLKEYEFLGHSIKREVE